MKKSSKKKLVSRKTTKAIKPSPRKAVAPKKPQKGGRKADLKAAPLLAEVLTPGLHASGPHRHEGPGRPSSYSSEAAALFILNIKAGFSQDMADLVLLKLKSMPKTVAQICKAHPELPSKETIYTWLAVDEEFATEFVKALAVRALLLAEDMLDQVYDNSKDYLVTKDEKGNEKREPDPAAIARARLIADKLQWYISKLLPKLFGNTGKDGLPERPKVHKYLVPGTRSIEGPGGHA